MLYLPGWYVGSIAMVLLVMPAIAAAAFKLRGII